jgi:hypothetical protein
LASLLHEVVAVAVAVLPLLLRIKRDMLRTKAAEE